jgi:hypothetical protein
VATKLAALIRIEKIIGVLVFSSSRVFHHRTEARFRRAPVTLSDTVTLGDAIFQ